MIYFDNKEAEIELFFGATPELARDALSNGAKGRNVLNVEMNIAVDGRYCLTVIFEYEDTGRQLLMEA